MVARQITLGALALVLTLGRTASADDARLAVVVHPSRAAQLDRGALQLIYMKKRRFWDDGSSIIVVNREADSAERLRFTHDVFGSLASYLPRYWNDEYFHGVLPPITLTSDLAVKRYLAARPNAIGYIDESSVDDSVRVVLTLD